MYSLKVYNVAKVPADQNIHSCHRRESDVQSVYRQRLSHHSLREIGLREFISLWTQTEALDVAWRNAGQNLPDMAGGSPQLTNSHLR